MTIATLTSKGQITLPKDVRTKLHLQTGEKIDFRIDEKTGSVTLSPLNRSVNQVFGILKDYRRLKKTSVEDMDSGISEKLRKEFR
jgi:antitoxin PrlF